MGCRSRLRAVGRVVEPRLGLTAPARVVRLGDRGDLGADRRPGSGSAWPALSRSGQRTCDRGERLSASALPLAEAAWEDWSDGRQPLDARRDRHQPGAGAARRVRRGPPAADPHRSSPSGPSSRCRPRTGWSASWSPGVRSRARRTGEYVVGRRLWDLGLLAPGADRAASSWPRRTCTTCTARRSPRSTSRCATAPRCSTWTGCAATPRCRSSARSGPGCRCTPPAWARCCSPTPRPTCRQRCWPPARVTPYTVTQPGRLRRQLARVLRDDYATTVEEMSLGACSVAVPVRSGAGVVAALGHRRAVAAHRPAPAGQPRCRWRRGASGGCCPTARPCARAGAETRAGRAAGRVRTWSTPWSGGRCRAGSGACSTGARRRSRWHCSAATPARRSNASPPATRRG